MKEVLSVKIEKEVKTGFNNICREYKLNKAETLTALIKEVIKITKGI